MKASYADFDIINYYRFSASTNIQQFTAEILSMLDVSRTQLVVGDANLDYLRSPNNQFTHSLEQRGYHQKVTKPTHINGSLLDQVRWSL